MQTIWQRWLAWGLLFSGSGAASGQLPDLVKFQTILTSQAKAWNRGDLDGFMEFYWKSPQLSFSSGGKTTHGWSRTRDGYKSRYPTQEQMGQLTFSDLELVPLCDSAALVLGRWHLRRAGDEPHGNFSLIFRRIDGQWRIVHDHTSLAAENAVPAAAAAAD